MPVTPDDVERALPAAREGDPAALEVLWRAYQPRLLRYLRGRGVRDAEDIATQVWLDAARNLRRFRGGADDFRRWLFTIAHHRFVDERRRDARRRAALTATPGTDGLAPGADVGVEEQDALARALQLVGRLPAQMRDVVLLRVVADLSVADTAAVTGLKPGHVRVVMHRALAQLERLLVEHDADVVTLPGRPSMKRST